MKSKELRELSDAELVAKLDQAHQELFNLRFQRATRQLQNYARCEQVRRDVARVNTIMRERELGITA